MIEKALIVFGGVLVGLLWGYAFKSLEIRKKTARKAFQAPAPVDLGYDVNNPINGRYNAKHGETVVIDGFTWYRM